MVKLTVKSAGKIGNTPTTLTPYSELFQETEMHNVKADGQDTVFTYKDTVYTVDETFAVVEALLNILTTTEGYEKLVWGLFDATGGKAIGTHDIVDPVTLVAVEVPINARVVQSIYIVETTFTSAGADAGTIALGYAVDGAAAIKAAVAISDGTNPYDAGTFATIPVGTAATLTVKTTAQRKLQAVVAAQNLTAGKLKIAVKYVIVP